MHGHVIVGLLCNSNDKHACFIASRRCGAEERVVQQSDNVGQIVYKSTEVAARHIIILIALFMGIMFSIIIQELQELH